MSLRSCRTSFDSRCALPTLSLSLPLYSAAAATHARACAGCCCCHVEQGDGAPLVSVLKHEQRQIEKFDPEKSDSKERRRQRDAAAQ